MITLFVCVVNPGRAVPLDSGAWQLEAAPQISGRRKEEPRGEAGGQHRVGSLDAHSVKAPFVQIYKNEIYVLHFGKIVVQYT